MDKETEKEFDEKFKYQTSLGPKLSASLESMKDFISKVEAKAHQAGREEVWKEMLEELRKMRARKSLTKTQDK